MKAIPAHLRVLVALMLMLLLAMQAEAQPCSTYFPFEKGAGFEMQAYNAKDKPTGRAVYTVLDVTEQGGATQALIRVEPFDQKNRPANPMEYTAHCKDGNLLIEMRRFLDPDLMKAYENMDVKAEATYLEVPGALAVGHVLQDAHLEAEILNEGRTMATVTIAITGRKVDAQEPVATPAGSFDAYKISGNMEVGTRALGLKMPSTNFATTEWYAKDIGVVRSETYRKGKLVGYSVLTRILK